MPPNGVRVAMEMQAEAERKKRAQILESEGKIAWKYMFWDWTMCLLQLISFRFLAQFDSHNLLYWL